MAWNQIHTAPPKDAPFLVATREAEEAPWVYEIAWWEPVVDAFIIGVDLAGHGIPLPDWFLWTEIQTP